MWPLLAELGVALLKQDANNREIEQQRRRALVRSQMDIANQRAARAGDSGYMQRALGEAQSFPRNPDNGTGMLLGVASGLMKQSEAGNAEDAVARKADLAQNGPGWDDSIGGAKFQDGDLPSYDDDNFDDPTRRSGGVIGSAFNRSRGVW